jgi:rhamnosyl/mannosyltransferase
MEATNAHLVIIGQGPLEGTIRELINDMNSNSKITLITSSVSDEELKAWFYNCDFLVLPSIARSEAFGIVQIEAMAVGKPVINTNLGTGVPFVSINNKTGLTVEVSNVEQLTNAINKLWGNKKLIREYGKSARIRAKNEFDCNVMLSRYIKAYIKVFNSKN